MFGVSLYTSKTLHGTNSSKVLAMTLKEIRDKITAGYLSELQGVQLKVDLVQVPFVHIREVVEGRIESRISPLTH